jgi:hypothetical protein
VFEAIYLDCAVLPARLQSQYSESSRDDDSLLLVVRRWDTLEELESLNGSCASWCLVRQHSSDGSEEDLAWCSEVERTGFLGVDQMSLVQELVVAELCIISYHIAINILSSIILRRLMSSNAPSF